MASSTNANRVTKPQARRSFHRRVRTSENDQPLVERTNALSIGEFISQYVYTVTKAAEQATVQASGEVPPSPQDANHAAPPLDVCSAASISERDLEACLDLVEQTSGEAYAASSAGWSRTKKRKEMKLPDMKYLILRHDRTDNSGEAGKQFDNDSTHTHTSELPESESQSVLGFLSFMVTYEDGKEVIYCYEIHMLPAARGRGLGKLLMERMEQIGRRIGLEKAMLTVFKSNETALRFYDALGYQVDDYSPQPRRLRNGTIKDVGYSILSKKLR